MLVKAIFLRIFSLDWDSFGLVQRSPIRSQPIAGERDGVVGLRRRNILDTVIGVPYLVHLRLRCRASLGRADDDVNARQRLQGEEATRSVAVPGHPCAAWCPVVILAHWHW